MHDREKVIERLQRVSCYFKSMLKVGYDGDADIYRENRESVKMAIDMLKEQAAFKPEWSCGKAYCGACGKRLPLKRWKHKPFCPSCGREVDWNA